MRRPLSIYWISFIYSIEGLLLLILVIMSEVGLLPQTDSNYFWYQLSVHTLTRVGYLASAFVLFLTAYGLWIGKSWGRTLSFVINLIIMISVIYPTLTIFASTQPAVISGMSGLIIWVRMIMLMVSAFVFYLTLRPEVGRFCGVYPINN